MTWPNPSLHVDWRGWASALIQKLASELTPKQSFMPKYSKGALPDPVRSQTLWIYVYDATDGACPAYSDGTAWRRVDDGSVVD